MNDNSNDQGRMANKEASSSHHSGPSYRRRPSSAKGPRFCCLALSRSETKALTACCWMSYRPNILREIGSVKAIVTPGNTLLLLTMTTNDSLIQRTWFGCRFSLGHSPLTGDIPSWWDDLHANGMESLYPLDQRREPRTIVLSVINVTTVVTLPQT